MQIHEVTDLAYERAIRGYLIHGDDLLLHEDLTALGFDRDEIQFHFDNPGRRIRQGFA